MRRALLAIFLPSLAMAKPKLVPDNLVDCTPTGLCRVGGTAPATPLKVMYSDAPGRFWGATERGLVVRWDGAKLSSWTVPDLHANDIWGTDTDAWVSAAHKIWRYHAGAWSAIDRRGDMFDAVSGVAGDGAWFASDQLFHVDEQGKVTAAPKPPGGARVVDLWVAARTDVWAITVSPGNKLRYKVMRFDGTKWRDTRAPIAPLDSTYTPGIAGSSASDVWVIVTNPYHWDGKAWRKLDGPDGSHISVSAPDDAIITRQHSVARWDGKAWTETAETSFVLTHSIGNGAFATSDFTLVDRAGARTPLPAGSGIIAWDLWAGPDAIYEVGSSKTHLDTIAVALWDGTRWSTQELGKGSASQIEGIDEPWIRDGAGGIWHREGGTWRREVPPIEDVVHLAVLSRTEVWVASLGGDLARRDAKGTWTKLPRLAKTEVNAFAAGPGALFAALVRDGKRSLARWDGTSFIDVAPLAEEVRRLVVRSANEVDVLTANHHQHWLAAAPGNARSVYYDITHDLAVDTANVYVSAWGSPYTGIAVEPRAGVPAAGSPTWHESPVPWTSAISVRDGVVWLMQRESGDLVVRRPTGTPASPR